MASSDRLIYFLPGRSQNLTAVSAISVSSPAGWGARAPAPTVAPGGCWWRLVLHGEQGAHEEDAALRGQSLGCAGSRRWEPTQPPASNYCTIKVKIGDCLLTEKLQLSLISPLKRGLFPVEMCVFVVQDCNGS